MSPAFEDDLVEESFDLSPSYIFNLPKTLEKIKVDNATIIIDIKSSIYITAFNEEQLNIFAMIEEGYNIGELAKLYNEENLNLQYIIMALINTDLCNIEGRSLELPNVNDSLFIYLTDQCNLSCSHCYRNATELHQTVLSLNEWLEILNEFKAHGGKEVTISGGEPLLYKDFINLCKHIKSLDLTLTVLSNGTLWKKYQDKDSDIEVIKSIDEIQISLDGYDEATNQKMRGENNFESTKNNLNWLFSLNSNISVAVTPSPSVLFVESEQKKLEAFILELSKNATIRLTHKILPNEQLQLTQDDERNYFNFISGLEDQIYPEGKLKRWVSHYFNDTAKENNCGWGNLTIAANGDVYTCNRLDASIKMGNALVNSMAYLINEGQKNRDLTSVDNIEPCKNCAVRYLCNGGCRIDEFIELSPSVKRYCNIIKKNNIYNNMVNASRYIYDL